MSLEDTQKKIKALDIRAHEIHRLKDGITKQVMMRMLLHDYAEVKSETLLDRLVKVTLLDYLVGCEPFPSVIKELKIKTGRPKNQKISEEKISHYLFKCKGSIRKTSQLLQIDRKTVKNRCKDAQNISNGFSSGEYSTELIEYFLQVNDDRFSDDFNADLQRFENKSKKK